MELSAFQLYLVGGFVGGIVGYYLGRKESKK